MLANFERFETYFIMASIKAFTFGPFQENTYIVYDSTKECVIFDPGCFGDKEKNELSAYIDDNNLKPVKLINTHGHIDHVAANKYVADKYKLGVEINEKDLFLLQNVEKTARMYGLYVEPSPDPTTFLNEGDVIKFGNTTLDILFTPGHSPGSLCFVDKADKNIIGGDVLFMGSIGRSDLPGGDFDTLIKSIREKLFTLPDDYTVYSGHGPKTSIGFEKKSNPFLQ